MEANDGKAGRGPGRPRVWVSEAERKRAYRARLADTLVEPARLRLELRAARKRIDDLERALARGATGPGPLGDALARMKRTATATRPPTRSSATRTVTCGAASAAACGDEPRRSGSEREQGSSREVVKWSGSAREVVVATGQVRALTGRLPAVGETSAGVVGDARVIHSSSGSIWVTWYSPNTLPAAAERDTGDLRLGLGRTHVDADLVPAAPRQDVDAG